MSGQCAFGFHIFGSWSLKSFAWAQAASASDLKLLGLNLLNVMFCVTKTSLLAPSKHHSLNTAHGKKALACWRQSPPLSFPSLPPPLLPLFPLSPYFPTNLSPFVPWRLPLGTGTLRHSSPSRKMPCSRLACTRHSPCKYFLFLYFL